MEHTAPAILELGLLLVLATLAGKAARRLGLPAVLGYLAVGHRPAGSFGSRGAGRHARVHRARRGGRRGAAMAAAKAQDRPRPVPAPVNRRRPADRRRRLALPRRP